MTLRKYQILVVGSLLLYAAYLLLLYTGWSVTRESAEALRYANAGAWHFTTHPLPFLVLLIARITATLGMFLTFTWGRNLLTAWLAVGVALGPLSGVVVLTATEATLGYLSATVDGAIVALSYSSRVSHLFRVDAAVQQGATEHGG
jgi:hypothetical protein